MERAALRTPPRPPFFSGQTQYEEEEGLNALIRYKEDHSG